MTSRPHAPSFPDELVDRTAPFVVWGLWAIMTAGALLTALFITHPTQTQGLQSLGLRITPLTNLLGLAANAGFPAAAAAAFTIAVRRVRGRMRIADAFFSLVLLNPLLVAKSTTPFDPTLLSTGLLGLMAGAIIAMKRDNYLRYLAVAALALALTQISESFIMLLPSLAAWLLFAGYSLARAAGGRDRVRGFAVLVAAEIALLVFGLACILVAPTATPHPATLFTTIVSFTEFPLLVLAIAMLALGWRTNPRPVTAAGVMETAAPVRRQLQAPPHFAGMLALLVGLLAMLLNNFQAGTLQSPGSDQTAVTLCLLYTVFALHGPRRLHYLVPPLLLAAEVAYTILR